MTYLDFFGALFIATLPLFLLAFALVAWALHKGWLKGDSVEALQGSIDALGKAQRSKRKRRKMDPALGKWFSFGGGFYGIVALYTWLLVEWEDVSNFLVGLGQILVNLNLGALIGLVIDLLIESFMNFVIAISWPAYWLSESRDGWVLLFAAYAGYWLGIKAAGYCWQRGWVSEVLRRWR